MHLSLNQVTEWDSSYAILAFLLTTQTADQVINPSEPTG
jgi:hypothetical protein